MKKTLTEGMFIDLMRNSSRGDSFSYKGLKVLFNLIEEREEHIGEEIEFCAADIDMIYNEDSLESILDYYDFETLEELEDNTIVKHVTDDIYIYEKF